MTIFQPSYLLCLVVVATLNPGCKPTPSPARLLSDSNGDSKAVDSQVDTPTAKSAIQRVEASHLPNAWRIHAKVISGGLPEGSPAFQQLKSLGVKTIISVDGAKPDVDLAKQHGMRYVHLPHGYDGVPVDRARMLAKAIKEFDGPIYIHCHHGKHRSPTAAVVACVGSGLLAPELGFGILKTAGTGENYRGLYQSAAQAVRFDDALLAALQVEYQETVELPPIADAMVNLEACFDKLKKLDGSRWTAGLHSAETDAAEQALLLRECYTELLRSNDLSHQPDGFIELVTKCEQQAAQLEADLLMWRSEQYRQPVPESVANGFSMVAKACVSCHKQYRDVPLSEKGSTSVPSPNSF